MDLSTSQRDVSRLDWRLLAQKRQKKGESTVDHILSLAHNTSGVDATVLRSSAGTFVLLGEDHYAADSKAELANGLLALEQKQHVHLVIEEPGEVTLWKDKLMGPAAHDLSHMEGWKNQENSLVERLGSVRRSEGFASRPEDIQKSVGVDLESMITLVDMALTCLDPRPGFAKAKYLAALDAVQDILATSLRAAEELSRNGEIGDIPLQVASEYIRSRKEAMRVAYRDLMSSWLDTSHAKSRLLSAFHDAIAAPHAVSDAVMATRFFSMRAAYALPVVVVAGVGHTELLAAMFDAMKSAQA